MLITVVLLALAGLALTITPEVTRSEDYAVKDSLPDRVADYQGHDILTCQNEQCQRSFIVTDLTDSTRCPVCGGKLDNMSPAEKNILPPDTKVVKKRYVNRQGKTIFVSLVFSGSDQRSIHRPQQCLTAQGYAIEKTTVIEASVIGRPPLKVMMLDARLTARMLNGDRKDNSIIFAYWFVGKGRETPYHLKRLLWMASDRIFRNVAYRWAYIAVSTDRNDSSSEQVADFIAALYPTIAQ